MTQTAKPPRKSVHPLRDALLAALVTFVTSAIGLSIVYIKARDAQLQAVRGELLQIARMSAVQVDGDLHRTITSRAQEGSPEHLRALAPLVRMHLAAQDVVDIYTGIMIDGRIYWILDSKYGRPEAQGPGPDDPIMKEYTTRDPGLIEAFARHAPIANSVPVKEPRHTYLSAYAPFYDRAGNFVGILGVDMVLDALEARMAVIRWAFEAALLAVLLMSLGAGAVALYLRRVTASVVQKLRMARAEAEASATAAQSATRAKAAFLAMMSHEIRTPMNGILGVADLLRTMSPDPQQKKLLDILNGSGESLLRIINDILDFSKIEAARLELRPQPFEVHKLLEELEHLVGTQARTKNISFVIDVDPQLPAAVNGDRQRLTQVLLNLTTNAVKFTDQGEVRLAVRLLDIDAEKVRLEFLVRDTGIGISAEALTHLFTPFTQLADSRRHRGSGTGLGLVIAKNIVGLMGGSIRVQSEVGKGSLFAFAITLPIAEMASATTTTKVLGLTRLAILVAEDNQVNQTIISAMLRQLGHSPTLVTTGQAALEALACEDFDLVLMDCNMPVMDGFEATRLLRGGTSGARDPKIPVIALTANALDGDREKCFAAGMDEFLSKPVTIAALRKAIDCVRGVEQPPAAGRLTAIRS